MFYSSYSKHFLKNYCNGCRGNLTWYDLFYTWSLWPLKIYGLSFVITEYHRMLAQAQENGMERSFEVCFYTAWTLKGCWFNAYFRIVISSLKIGKQLRSQFVSG